jgi:CTP:molybdopterin cytidylyltransferase MocA
LVAAAVVLAAGKGERMGGVSKAALRLPDGRTFVEAIAAAARTAGCTRVVVVAAEPHLAATTAAARAAGCDVVENPSPERGMASSLAAGLAALGPDVDVALSWPVDHPSVRADTVRAVLAASSPDGFVVPRHADRGGHPTAFGRDTWREVAAAIDSPDGVRALLRARAASVVRVDVDDSGTVEDVDAPRV